MSDTIIGIATGLSESSVNIIRISGDEAISIVNNITTIDLTTKPTHSINYAHIKSDNEIIDEVLISLFLAPKSYTCEDVVEINCHGGIISTKKIINLLLSNGARMAEPGEFTKLAFLNGRINLNEAEAVMDIIKASSEKASSLAVQALQGSLTKQIKSIKQNLIAIISELEVSVDYPEFEVDETEDKQAVIEESYQDLKKLTNNFNYNQKIFNGINIALIGKPNVGKSSLLNLLLDEEKAIVTDIAGTTRDVIEGSISINGIKINFIDTAGIRDTNDIIEKIGVSKSLEQLKKADLILYVIDNQTILDEDELEILKPYQEKVIVIFNKTDLSNHQQKINMKHIYTNINDENSISNLKNLIIETVQINDINVNQDLYLNERQYHLVSQAEHELLKLNDNFNNQTIDLLLIDLRNICEILSEITGEVYYDDLLDNIFANFCLGK